MKHSTLLAGCLISLSAFPVLAESPKPAIEGPPGAGAPPASVITQINLGNAGLLAPFYSDLEYGTVLQRVGQSRSRVNTINNGPRGTPTTGYENSSFTVALPWIFRAPIDETSNFTVKLVGVTANEGTNRISEDAQFGFAAVGYEWFYSPTGMFAVELGYRGTEIDRTTGAFDLRRNNLDFKLSFAQQITDEWGAVGRVVYSPGKTKTDIGTPFGIAHAKMSDYYVYNHFDLIGNYSLSFLPDDWKFHPQLGLTYLTSWSDETTNSLGGRILAAEDRYGSVQAIANFEKQVRPGSFSPVLALGVEHVFKDDLAAYSNEKTYGIVQVGLGYLDASGFATYVGIHHREGFAGQRSSTELTIAGNIRF
ncbi:autotransporter domain-containing protein [Rhizobium sp. FKY42]|uniref:autotransporter domain-containing protein n=1 Tax=Rhizobium sp. FKY42 TaxID=2562310 RepID=UPI0010BF76D0|nr:autotransporter domain-containing protein [Rhizobium sp. FKY42]